MSIISVSGLDPVGPFGDLPLGDVLYEVIDGEEVEKPFMGAFGYLIAGILSLELGIHVKHRGLGRVVPEALFRLNPEEKRMRRPDVAYVSYDRWARDRKVNSANGWEVVPDLAVEVVSPTDCAVEVIAKAREYQAAGVAQIWLIYSNVREVHVFGNGLQIRVIGPTEAIDGGDLLPGFRLPLAELFRDGEDPQVV